MKKLRIQKYPDTCGRDATRTTPNKELNDQNNVAVYLGYKSLYISLLSSTKREKTKFYVVLRNTNKES